MFKLEEFMGKRVLKSSFIDDADVVAFFTTRDLPLKAGEREDLIEEVENNKILLCEGLDIPLENLVIPIQTHSDNVGIINRRQDAKRLRGIEKISHASTHLHIHSSYENTDSLVTNERNIALALNFADCVPIIFYDPVNKVIAIAHAGWRGTAAKIGPKTVEKMVKSFGCEAEDIIALIGPSIGECCFEAKEDVLQKLRDSLNIQDSKTFSESCNNLGHADLKLINKLQLLANGIKKIDVCEYCTSCQSELFFSYRKEKGITARHSAVIMLK